MRAVLRFGTVLLLVAVFKLPAFASATNIYITQSGVPTGNCTTNVQTPAFFNNAANWGTGANQIGPGTTVLICGAFTFSAGTSGLSVQGSGAVGSPIIIKFDTGASLSAPYFSTNDGTSPTSGAITISGVNYITVDGGTACGYTPAGGRAGSCNGSISSTADGTALTYQSQNAGILIGNATGIDIRNLRISSIYLRTGTGSSDSTPAANSADIWVNGCISCSIHDNQLGDAHSGILWNLDSGATANPLIYHNYIYHHGWHINVGGGDNGSKASGVTIYGNEFTNWQDWADANATYHTDGIITYSDASTSSGASVTGEIYDNYFHGDLGGGTGANAVSYYVSLGVNSKYNVFNNVLDNTGGANIYGGLIDISGQIGGSYPQNGSVVANNTMLLNGNQDSCIGNNGVATFTADNNICSGSATDWWFSDNSYRPITSDYNVLYAATYIASENNGPGPPSVISSLATWQNTTAQDTHSTTSNPSLSSTYLLQAGSSAIGAGTNLTSLGIAALNVDRLGNPRPTSGAWDAGANQYSTTTSQLSPPTGLTGVVQ